ncbi:MAG TPA: DUF3618 domain-containing protein [Solirubrobacterales bacterium]|jgi:hypothetical protein|nr:DUF3618 domain-containing protein [Solirubrobacterales bacterium]
MSRRSPEEIRASIEQNRNELVLSVNNARNEVARLTDWRGFAAQHKRELTVAAAAAGFLIGGRLMMRSRKRR